MPPLAATLVLLSAMNPLTAGKEGSLHPSWSKDGRWVAFQSDRDGDHEVYVVRTDGSGLRHLAAGVHPTWSPDGSRILYMSEAGSGTWEISTMSASGEDRRCLSCARRGP